MTGAFLGFRTYSGETQLHAHPHDQVVLPHRGKLELEIAGRSGVVAPGVGAHIRAGARHAFAAVGANAFIVLDTDVPAAAWDVADDRGAFFPVTPAMQGLLDYLVATLAQGAAHDARRTAWTRLLVDSLAEARSAQPDRASVALARAMVFLRRHATEPIDVAAIASAAGLSTTRLYALFRQRLHTTPHAELARLRLDAAQRLLANTELSIAEIAIRTGHADQSTLTRRMGLSRGLTPAAFRRVACRGRTEGDA